MTEKNLADPGTLVVSGERTSALLDRVDRIEVALERALLAMPDEATARVRRTLTEVRGRLALGVDRTVVALVGGTGSGKSSLFNALARLDFADVGVRRPTTSQVTACVWAQDATPLLDWLGVANDRRIERESALDGDSQADLRGLVLLDLPDHDSIEAEHRAVVDRLLPQVDLLVWVVDPQKYADDALHTGYLRHLVGHEASMLVVLNQIDTVPVDAQAALMRDVDRLLREDGLEGVGVHGVSARTGVGLPVLRGVLADAVERRGIAEVRAASELDDAARELRRAVGTEELDPAALPREAATDALAYAVGLPGAIDAARDAGRSSRRVVAGPAQGDHVELVRRTWLERVGQGLPEPWRERLDEQVAPLAELTSAAGAAVAEVVAEPVRSRAASAWRTLGAVVGLAALVVAGVVIGAVAGAHGWTDTATLAAVAGGAGLLLAAGAWGLAARAERSAGRRRSAQFAEASQAALAEVVETRLARPSVVVLADHRAVREVASV